MKTVLAAVCAAALLAPLAAQAQERGQREHRGGGGDRPAASAGQWSRGNGGGQNRFERQGGGQQWRGGGRSDGARSFDRNGDRGGQRQFSQPQFNQRQFSQRQFGQGGQVERQRPAPGGQAWRDQNGQAWRGQGGQRFDGQRFDGQRFDGQRGRVQGFAGQPRVDDSRRFQGRQDYRGAERFRGGDTFRSQPQYSYRRDNDRRWDGRGDFRWRQGWRNDTRFYGDRGNYLRFRASPYRWPSGFGFQRWSVRQILPPVFLSRTYYIDNFFDIGLPYPPPGLEWIRVGDDALLVDIYTGEIVDVVPDVFYW